MATTPILFTSTVLRRPWVLHLYWAEVAGRPECVGVAVFGGGVPIDAETFQFNPDELQPVTSEAWRGLPFRSIIEDTRAGLVNAFAAANPAGFKQSAWAGGEYDVRGWPAGHLADVARVYLEAWGTSSNPTTAVAEHFSVSKTAAAKWVARCRTPEVGLLPPTTQGRAAGATLRPSTRNGRPTGATRS